MRCGYKHFGNESRVVRPLKIEGKGNIWIGEDALIQYKSWLAAVPLTGEKEVDPIPWTLFLET